MTKPARACRMLGFDCGGHGYHELKAYEVHVSHDTFKPFRTFVTFRAPCVCAAGARWVNRHVAPSTPVS